MQPIADAIFKILWHIPGISNNMPKHNELLTLEKHPTLKYNNLKCFHTAY